MKTGFICDSGYNVVASATREGRRLVAVVLGEASGRDRTVRAASLLEHGFQTYDWKQFFNATTVDSLPMAADAKGPLSIRKSIVSWSCGGRKPAVAAAKKGPRAAKAAAATDPVAKAATRKAGKNKALVKGAVAAPAPQPKAQGDAAQAAAAPKAKPAAAKPAPKTE